MHNTSRRRQYGVASLLAVIFVSLGILALSRSISYDARNVQDATLTVHKVTQSQSRAWKGAELLRLWLQSLSATDAANLAPGNIPIVGVDNLTATLISNVPLWGGRKINITLLATGADNTATSTLDLVYLVKPTTTTNQIQSDPMTIVANIKGGLSVSGWLKYFPPAGANIRSLVNIDGPVDLSATVLNLDQICATGDITIGGANSVNSVCSNGNLTLSDSASVKNTALIKGSVLLNGATMAGNIVSNGSVTANTSSYANTISAKGVVSINGNSSVNSINSESNVFFNSGNGKTVSIGSNGDIKYSANSPSSVLKAVGNVQLTGNGNVKDVGALGDVSITSGYALGVQGTLQAAGTFNWGSNITVRSGTVGGAISPALQIPPWAPPINVVRKNGYSPSIPNVVVPTVSNNFSPMLTVDVYPLESSAHYVFKVDAQGRRTVTVRKIKAIADGTYFLGDYFIKGNAYKDYLCNSVDSAGNCTAPATPYRTICSGYSQQNGCFTYSGGSKTWIVAGTTIAPGVVYFEGNLNVGNGVYFNTWLATGDLMTSGQTTSYSVNFAGYAGVCTNTSDKGRSASGLFTNMYPTDYCDITKGVMTPQPLGNSVYLAGGYKNGVFSGGNITIGNSSDQYGTVVAGNSLVGGGSTVIHGQVIAAGQGPSLKSSFTGGVTIDLRGIPTTADTTNVVCMVNCTSNVSSGGTTTLIWSSYQ